MDAELLDRAVSAARQAGAAVMSHYRRATPTRHKADGSPLTAADLAAHRTIAQWLGPTGIPLVSEEGESLQMEASLYWLVDPLDGTKDFLAGNDEFTVNVALVRDGRPLLGVVYAPALDECCVGGPGLGAWSERLGARTACEVRDRSAQCRLAVSRFHDHPDVEIFARANRITERVALGSALKYCRLATGQVDVFPRLVGSSEWDTAAGQAVLEGAGGQVLDWRTGQPLRYGKPGRRNPRLLSLRAPYALQDFIRMNYETDIA